MSKEIKKIYKKAGLKSPNGKGIHTASFHRCVVSVAKKQGGMKGKVSPHAVCMSSIGAEKAVKKGHRRSKKEKK